MTLRVNRCQPETLHKTSRSLRNQCEGDDGNNGDQEMEQAT